MSKSNDDSLCLVRGDQPMMEIGPRYTKPLNQSHRRKVFMSIGGGSLESRYKGTLKDQHEVQHIMYQM
nr:hypothetical protein Q903MT_gene5976 [Picea sitchensis]